MPNSNSDDEDDAPSSSDTMQNQGEYRRNDINLINNIQDHIMFQNIFILQLTSTKLLFI